MANIFDYIQWRDLSIEKVEFNEIDNLILARLSYFPLDGVVNGEEEISITEAYEKYEKLENKGRILQQEDTTLFPILAKSTRFGKMKLTNYINKIDPKQEKQFSAVTILMPDNTIYVAYRGTDNTIVGWKEDFNMSFSELVPAQTDAANYLNNIAYKYKNNIRVGGHSKGGNLAVYAAAFCDTEIQDRIINVYNNDGPGFHEDIINTEEYKRVINKVTTYIPQDSIFGMLLNHEEKYTIVQSNEKGLMEHDAYSWQVLGKKFVVLKEVTNESKFIDKTIKNWLKDLDMDTRQQVIDIVFEILNSTNSKTIQDLKFSLVKNARIILSSYKQITPENKKMIEATVTALLGIVKENVKAEYKKFKILSK